MKSLAVVLLLLAAGSVQADPPPNGNCPHRRTKLLKIDYDGDGEGEAVSK